VVVDLWLIVMRVPDKDCYSDANPDLIQEYVATLATSALASCASVALEVKMVDALEI
jgi:hypothetical protein